MCDEHDWEIIDEWFYDSFMFGGIVKRVHMTRKKCRRCNEIQEGEMYWRLLYDERN